jgi:hypothetical protein
MSDALDRGLDSGSDVIGSEGGSDSGETGKGARRKRRKTEHHGLEHVRLPLIHPTIWPEYTFVKSAVPLSDTDPP